jgi:hypothetical protein
MTFSITTLSITTLSIATLSITTKARITTLTLNIATISIMYLLLTLGMCIMQNVFIPSVAFSYCYVECQCDECHYFE